MPRWGVPALLVGAVILGAPLRGEAHPPPTTVTTVTAAAAAEVPEARIWLDRGVDPVLQPGEHVRVYFRSNVDAYVALLHVDTGGRVQLLFPASPAAPEWIRGDQDYRLLRSGATTWLVDEEPGMGYYFLLTSTEALDYGALGYGPGGPGWDLSRVGDRIRSDPYMAMDEFVELLLPHWQDADFALDYVTYHVGRPYSYPRFLCYDCHTEQSYTAWNPYHRACTDFRVVIYNDPYFYPSTRFQGSRVVYTRPPLSGRPQFEFKARVVGEPGSPLIRSRDGGVRAGALPRELAGPRIAPESETRGTLVRPPLRGEVLLREEAPPAGGPPNRPVLQRRPPPSAGGGPPPVRSGGGG